jgi:capsular exopolysaccharide synthesis family protein
MGKVFEALNRSERERPQSPINASTKNRAISDDQDATEFDFLQYSLNTPPAYEIERDHENGSSEKIASHHEFQPSRTVSIDKKRIDPRLVAFYDFDPRAGEQYLKLAISLMMGATERPLKRVLIASAQQGDGRTSVLLNLACLLAQAKKRVLVVDTDLRQPSVHRLLGVETETGMGEVAEQHLPVESAAIRVLPQDFSMLPMRERVDNSAEFLASTWLRDALHQLDAEYDFILFDSSPLLMTGDSQLLTRLTDATVLVISAGKTTTAQMAKAIAPLTQENIFGVVINRAER